MGRESRQLSVRLADCQHDHLRRESRPYLDWNRLIQADSSVDTINN
ncbi:hypothetical protein [Halolamina sp.]